MQPNIHPKLGRYSKASKPLLVDYINYINNRRLAPEQLNFANPVIVDETGLTTSDVSFASGNGWSDEVQKLTYRRVNLNDLMNNQPLAIHVPDLTAASLLAGILQQYGLFLEPGLIDITRVDISFDTIAPVLDAAGLDHADTVVVAPVVPPYLQNSTWTITFHPEHLIFFGSITVITRQSLTLLGETVDCLMDLREFYSNSNQNLPPVELILEDGEIQLDDTLLPYKERRQYESDLYVIVEGSTVDATSTLTQKLHRLTGDDWVCVPDQSLPFNLYGATVLYNGFVSKAYTVKNPAFNYVFCLDLSKWCNNLTGILKIAYRYSDSDVPGNLAFNQASTQPLFYR